MCHAANKQCSIDGRKGINLKERDGEILYM